MEWRFKREERVIPIGDKFVVAPPWLETERIKISLVKGQSFGTGVHETTVSCIELMEKIDLNGKSVLDIGAGSGILSIAASKLGADFVVGFDIEKQAVKECRKNAELNGVKSVECFVSDTPRSLRKQFDIIIANIFADIILGMRDEIARITKGGGFALFSGISIEDNFTVQMAFGKMGFNLLKNIFLEDYTTLLFKKGE